MLKYINWWSQCPVKTWNGLLSVIFQLLLWSTDARSHETLGLPMHLSTNSTCLAQCQPFPRVLGPVPEEEWEEGSSEILSMRSSSQASLNSFSKLSVRLRSSSLFTFSAWLVCSCWPVCRHLDNINITLLINFWVCLCSWSNAATQANTPAVDLVTHCYFTPSRRYEKSF